MNDSHIIAERAEKIYEARLRETLEATNLDDFVAIEPKSGDYFLGSTLTEAIQAARKAYPNRRAHVVRIGHKAAIHIGNWLDYGAHTVEIS